MKILKLEGILAAPFTPFDENGELNPSQISVYAKKLQKDGLSGVFICGTTGEGMLMTLQERKIVAEEWVKFQKESFKIIVHVGTTSSKQSQELAKHAQNIGAYATSTMGPLFLKTNNIDPLVSFCAEIASASADIPFFYYHIPLISGIKISMTEFIMEAKTKIPNFSGVKYTHNNFVEIGKCNKMDEGKWNILNGFDENLFSTLKIGISAAVGSTYNYMGLIYLSMINDFKAGKIMAAEKKQKKCNNIIEVILNNGGPIIAGKAIMKWVGIDCGPCRLPLTKLSEKALSDLYESLNKKDLFKLN